MSSPAKDPNPISTSSTGQSFTDDSHLDAHYQLAKEAYDQCIGDVGIQPGWHVLDAGCGSGVFLPHIARLVGPAGKVTALDLAPEHVEKANRLSMQGRYACEVVGRQGSVTELPFADDSFDCVWSANVSQYLTDDEFAASLRECRRVVKSGGLVAVKEFDMTSWQYAPVDIRLIWRLFDAFLTAGALQAVGASRGVYMFDWLRKHDLTPVLRKSYHVERWAPMPEYVDYFADMIRWLAAGAQAVPLSDADKAEWQRIGDNATAISGHPDFCSREGFTVAVGRKD